MLVQHKLGRVAGHRHPALPRMAVFLNSVKLPPLPEKVDYYSKVASWPMLLNQEIGDCTIASVGHMIQQESIYTDTPDLVMTDAEALAGYQAVTGYVPGRPETDTGAYEGDIGTHWLTHGFMCGGQLDKIVGFADFDAKNLTELKYSIMLSGNAFLGFNLPACAEEDPVWDLPKTPAEAEMVGGHAVPAVGFDAKYVYVISWGQLVPVTYPFYQKFCDEAHVTLSHRWMNSNGLTPGGINWNALVADTKAFLTQIH